MKVKKIEINRNKLLKLKLINTRVYNKTQHDSSVKIEDIEYRLKKAVYLIYKYNLLNKKILFVGVPARTAFKVKKLFKNKIKHIFIPNFVWSRGVISNKKTCFSHLSKSKKISNNTFYKTLFQLRQNVDLVVVMDKPSNVPIIEESYLSRTPMILINGNLSIKESKPSYKIPGDFQFNDNLLYSILISVFKKNNRNKNSLVKAPIIEPGFSTLNLWKKELRMQKPQKVE